jgi:hypothetical protein
VHTVRNNTSFSLLGISRVAPKTHCTTSIRRHAAGLSLLTLAILGLSPVRAQASLPVPVWNNYQQLSSIAAAPDGGFWVQLDLGQTGATVAHAAPDFDRVFEPGSIAAIPGRNGYWVVSPRGEIFARGDAPQLCEGKLANCSGFPSDPSLRDIIVGAVATPSGNGLWALKRDGQVFTAGDATFYGEVFDEYDLTVATGIVATPSGKGYYIVQEDGGVFSFGDALFYGSTGGNKPGGKHVNGIALSYDYNGAVNGYWLAAEDGGVFTFGEAPFWGNPGINPTKVTSIVSFPAHVPGQPPQRTRGYALVHDNGSVGVHVGVHYGTLPGPERPQPGPGTPPLPEA